MTLKPQIKKSALIAGAGLAGLAAAVYLDELGYEVTLIEKKTLCGGRAFSFTDKKTGLTIDNGQHLMIGAYHETISLLERIGAKRHIFALTPTIVPLVDGNLKKNLFTLRGFKPPFGLLLALVRYSGFTMRDKIGFIKLGRELQRIQSGKIETPHSLSVNQWLRAVRQTKSAIKNFWEVLTLATLNDSPEVASADALVTVLLKSCFAAPHDGQLIFPKTGLNKIFADPVSSYLKLRGQRLVTGVGLKEIKILNGRVQAFVLGDGTQKKADLYVTALPHHRLLSALPVPFIDATPELSVLRGFTYSPIVSINLFYDRPVMDEIFTGSSATNVHWFFSKTHNGGPDPYHVVGVISGAYDFLDKSKDELVALAKSEFEQLYPAARHAKLTHALVNIERQATLSCGVGVNAQRPKQKVLENFYIIGDWTKTGLPPTIESAVVSAKLMADEVSAGHVSDQITVSARVS